MACRCSIHFYLFFYLLLETGCKESENSTPFTTFLIARQLHTLTGGQRVSIHSQSISDRIHLLRDRLAKADKCLPANL